VAGCPARIARPTSATWRAICSGAQRSQERQRILTTAQLIDAKDGARVANNPLFLRDVLADLCAGEVRTIILHRSTAVESAIGEGANIAISPRYVSC
jgi:hypothetical protein